MPTGRTAHRIVYPIISHPPHKIKRKYAYTAQKYTLIRNFAKNGSIRPQRNTSPHATIPRAPPPCVTIRPPREYNTHTDVCSEAVSCTESGFGASADSMTGAKSRR